MSTTVDILAPAEQTEGTRSQILRWLKGVGDAVAENEPLIEIETDKVTVEVAAPAGGVLLEILKGEAEEIAPGDVLGRLGNEAENAASPATSERGARYATNDALRGRAAESSAGGRAEGTNVEAARQNGATAQGAAALGSSPGAPAKALGLSPAVRRLLAERGLEASDIQGSGEGGRITVDDVLTFNPAEATPPQAANSTRAENSTQAVNPAQGAGSSAARHAESQAQGLQPTPTTRPATAQHAPAADHSAIPSHQVPHSAIRKRIADHMVQSLLQTAPHVTTVFEADMTSVMAHRAANKATFEQRGAPLTFTAYFLAATVKAIQAVPEANSRWSDAALDIYDAIHIGIATAIEGVGLVVPVLKDVQSKSLFDIARGLDDLVTAARAGKLQPADVRGGTFTISNHGVSGSLLATPIVINQPQSAILGVGKLEKRVAVVEQNGKQEFQVRPKCYVTLTIDHRVMDGHQANHFLQTFVRALETWPAQ